MPVKKPTTKPQPMRVVIRPKDGGWCVRVRLGVRDLELCGRNQGGEIYDELATAKAAAAKVAAGIRDGHGRQPDVKVLTR